MVRVNEVQLGTIPMEELTMVLRVQLQSVDVNPESPMIPGSMTNLVRRNIQTT
ncbi:MAG: hypothetical protein ACK55E_03260 [Cyanobacteriota bacterium]|jgi:hypothetical protein